LTVNGRLLQFELDTGADVTIGTIEDWLTLGKPQLKLSHDQLFAYGGQPIHVKGRCTVDVNYKGKSFTLPLFVVQGTGSSLCGQNWIDALNIDLNEFYYGSSPTVNVKPLHANRVYSKTKLSAVLDKYTATFSPGLGRCTKAKAALHLRPDAWPRFFKPRPIPCARLRPCMPEEIDEDLNIVQEESKDTSSETVPEADPEKTASTETAVHEPEKNCSCHSTGVSSSVNETPLDVQAETHRYPARDRRPPDRYTLSMALSQKPHKKN